PATSPWNPGSMKSGPILKGCTTSPRRRSASSSPSVRVVFPTPLATPAITSAGITGLSPGRGSHTRRPPSAGVSQHPRRLRAPREELPPSQELDVRLGGLAAVDRQHVLRTGRERDDRVHLRAEHDVLSRPRDGRQVLDALAGDVLGVLEEIERARRLRRG